MKPLEINRDSWHYKFICLLNDLDEPDDLCAYTRRFVRNIIFCLISAAFALVVLSCVGDSLGWIFAMLLNWQWIQPIEAAVVGNVGLLIGFAILYFIYIHKHVIEVYRLFRYGKNYHDKMYKPGMITIMYQNFRDKTCIRVKYK